MLEARIAVIGATGAVGAVMIQLLRERGYGQVRAFASARSTGRQLDGGLVVEEATPEALQAGDIDIAFFSVAFERVVRARAARLRGRSRPCGQVIGTPPAGRNSAGCPLGELRACPRARRHPRQSELLHDPAHE